MSFLQFAARAEFKSLLERQHAILALRLLGEEDPKMRESLAHELDEIKHQIDAAKKTH